MKKVFYVLCLLHSLCLYSQTEKNGWLNYCDKSKQTGIAEYKNGFLIATHSDGLFQVDYSGNIIRSFSKTVFDNANITCVATDVKENVWVGTTNGVYKYNQQAWTHFTTADGLSNNSITSIVIDGDDKKWIGTWGGGVSVFDNSSWTSLDKTQESAFRQVYAIAIDTKGNKWIATYNGVVKFDGTQYTTYGIKEGLPNGAATAIVCQDDGTVWLGETMGSVAKFDGTNWKIVISGNTAMKDVTDITVDKNGCVWVTTNGDGLIAINQGKYKYYHVADNLSSETLTNILIDTKGVIWYTSADGGAGKIDGTSFSTYPFISGIGGIYAFVNDIAIDASGVKWLATKNGVFSFDGKSWTSYTEQGFLPDNDIICVVVDKENNKWFGGYNGLLQYNNSVWTNYTTTDGITNNKITALAFDKYDTLWMATAAGVTSYKDKKFTKYVLATDVPGNSATGIAIDNNNVKWISTLNGLVQLSGSNMNRTTTDNGLKENYITSVATDKENSLWIIYDTYGAARYENSWVEYPSNIASADNSMARLYFDANNNLWAASYNAGILKRTNTNWTSYNVTSGLHNNQTECLLIDRYNNLWVGSNRGLSVYNESGVILESTPENTVIEESTATESTPVYPNPFDNTLTINNSADNTTAAVALYNEQGQLVLQTSVLHNQTIETSKLKSGIYLLLISNSHGQERKVMIKK